jgi:hypothetical protein
MPVGVERMQVGAATHTLAGDGLNDVAGENMLLERRNMRFVACAPDVGCGLGNGGGDWWLRRFSNRCPIQQTADDPSDTARCCLVLPLDLANQCRGRLADIRYEDMGDDVSDPVQVIEGDKGVDDQVNGFWHTNRIGEVWEALESHWIEMPHAIIADEADRATCAVISTQDRLGRRKPPTSERRRVGNGYDAMTI